MLPQPILSEVMTYLSLPELLKVSLVNRRFYSASMMPSVYRREFISEWMTSTDSLKQASFNWKSLCLAGLSTKKYWQNLSDCLFTESELFLLYSEIIYALKAPPLAFPVLRREMFCFPTLIQDLLANPEDQYVIEIEDQEYSEVIFKYLSEFAEDLYSEVNFIEIAGIRWNVKKTHERDSIDSLSTQSSEENQRSYLVDFFKGIKKCIKNYCEGVSNVIEESQNPLTAYSEYWENFAFSIKKINSLFLPVTELINDFYESKYQSPKNCPRINFVKIMTNIWRQKVFEKCKEKILEGVISEINDLRKSGISFDRAIESKRICEGLLDLSLNEISIFFKNHSLVKFEGPYQYLHLSIIDYYSEYYLNSGSRFEDDEDILRNIFLNATVREIRRVFCKSEGRLKGNEELIRESLNFDKNDDDFMIEWQAQSIGIDLQTSSQEIWRFSQCRDSKIIDILNQLQIYFECSC